MFSHRRHNNGNSLYNHIRLKKANKNGTKFISKSFNWFYFFTRCLLLWFCISFIIGIIRLSYYIIFEDTDDKFYIEENNFYIPSTQKFHEIQKHTEKIDPEIIEFGIPNKKQMPYPCIVILTYNRPSLLLQTVKSIQSIPGYVAYQLYISQDGNHQQTTSMIKNNLHAIPYKTNTKEEPLPIKHIQHHQKSHHRSSTEKLAIHYGFMFHIIFEELKHSHAIILEDDMIFSKDFLELFASTVHLLNDETQELFCISSWNDYGQNFLQHSAEKLFRTNYFPGLGWMLTNKFWSEISAEFPMDHWDHFLRLDTIHKQRDCICPQISRNFNIGRSGSTTDEQFYVQYLLPMEFDSNSEIFFRELDLRYLKTDIYEARMISLMTDSLQLKDAIYDKIHLDTDIISSVTGDLELDFYGIFLEDKELDQISLHSERNVAQFVGVFGKDNRKIFDLMNSRHSDGYRKKIYIVAYFADSWAKIASHLKLMTSQRTQHKYTIVIEKNDAIFIFCNIRRSPYLRYHSQGKYVMQMQSSDMKIIRGERGQSCTNVCKMKGYHQCMEDQFEYLNECSVLKKHFRCENGCMGGVVGKDVPNYVSHASFRDMPLSRKCLTTETGTTCGARHSSTQRLCPCI